ncbi:hypothetical protein [Alteromonas portus]
MLKHAKANLAAKHIERYWNGSYAWAPLAHSTKSALVFEGIVVYLF